jgi:hypothetical protein
MKRFVLVFTLAIVGVGASALYVSKAPASGISKVAPDQISIQELMNRADRLADNTVHEAF